jgi:FdhD protein
MVAMSYVPSTLVRQFEIERVERGSSQRLPDTVAAEEPLQIHLQYRFKGAARTTPLAVTMRTPGHDREFAAGFLLTEGIINDREEIVEIRALGIEPSNEILIELAANVDVDTWILTRNGALNSSCGICGKRTLDAAYTAGRPLPVSGLALTPGLIESLPERLRSHQEGFGQTGGLHAAAVFDFDGVVTSVFEDIGRHNALDKAIGYEFLLGRTPLTDRLLFLSSRSSFELVQKAMMAGASALVTVGGPSSLAIQMARAYGLTLVGFVREQRFNVYAGDWRIKSE